MRPSGPGDYKVALTKEIPGQLFEFTVTLLQSLLYVFGYTARK